VKKKKVDSWVTEKSRAKRTRSSATAEKQRVSCAHIPRLASWPVDHAFTLGGSMYSIYGKIAEVVLFYTAWCSLTLKQKTIH